MEEKKMIKKLRNWALALIASIVALSVFSFPVVQATENPLTDVVITKVETDTLPKEMTLEDLTNGIDLSDSRFGDGAQPLPGVSFTYYSVSETELDDLIASNAATPEEVAVHTDAVGVATGETDANGQVTIPALPEGHYWIIENTKGTIASSTAVPFALSLPFTNSAGTGYLPTVHVYPKNTLEETPTIDKTVDNENVAIGTVNTWNVLMAIPKGIEDYKTFGFIDEIDSRLDYIGNLTVSADGVTLAEDTDYTVTYTNAAGQVGKFGALEGQTLSGVLSVSFTPAGRQKLAQSPSENVTIAFQTAVNKTAIMGLDIKNDVVLEYDNGHGDFSTPSNPDNPGEPPITPEEPPFVHTGGKAFVKQDRADNAPLNGAEFKIKTSENKFVIVDQDGKVTFGSENEATIFTSDSDGKFEVRGLPYGSYVLVETKAPEGYVLPTNPETAFEVDATSYYTDPTVITDGATASNNEQVIANIKMTIPRTGGMGTIAFTVIGGLLMLLSIVYYKKENTN